MERGPQTSVVLAREEASSSGLGIHSQHRGVPSLTELQGPAQTSSPVSLERVSIHHSSGHSEKKLPVAWG